MISVQTARVLSTHDLQVYLRDRCGLETTVRLGTVVVAEGKWTGVALRSPPGDMIGQGIGRSSSHSRSTRKRHPKGLVTLHSFAPSFLANVLICLVIPWIWWYFTHYPKALALAEDLADRLENDMGD